MFSQKNLVIILVIVIGILSYQTVVLANMGSKLKEAQIGLGNSVAAATAVNLSDNVPAPQMVGGC